MLNSGPFRIPPAMEPQQYKTYRLVAPKSSHWTKATCAEVDCAPYKNGWTSLVDETTVKGAQTAHAIRTMYRVGAYREERMLNGTLFTFSAGQPCFQASTHMKRIQRPDLCLVQGGDYRGNPLHIPTVTHTKPEFWAEDFAEHQNKLAKIIDGS